MEAMRFTVAMRILVCGGVCFAAVAWLTDPSTRTQPAISQVDQAVESAYESIDVIRDDQIRLCQGYDEPVDQNQWVQASGTGEFQGGFYGTQSVQDPLPSRTLQGVDQFTTNPNGRESKWRDSQEVPW